MNYHRIAWLDLSLLIFTSIAFSIGPYLWCRLLIRPEVIREKPQTRNCFPFYSVSLSKPEPPDLIEGGTATKSTYQESLINWKIPKPHKDFEKDYNPGVNPGKIDMLTVDTIMALPVIDFGEEEGIIDYDAMRDRRDSFIVPEVSGPGECDEEIYDEWPAHILGEKDEEAPDVWAICFFPDQVPSPINMEEVRILIEKSLMESFGSSPRCFVPSDMVIVRVKLDKKGLYEGHEFLNTTDRMLKKLVRDHIHLLEFTPAIQGGRPIPFAVNIPFRFRIFP